MVRVIEASGSSARSWNAAVDDAVKSTKDQADRPIGVEVVRMWADLGPTGRPGRYRALVRVAYRQRLVRPRAGPGGD